MKFLTAKLHGLGDYAAAAVLIVAPFFLGLNEQSMIAHWASVAGGVGLIIYSLSALQNAQIWSHVSAFAVR